MTPLMKEELDTTKIRHDHHDRQHPGNPRRNPQHAPQPAPLFFFRWSVN